MAIPVRYRLAGSQDGASTGASVSGSCHCCKRRSGVHTNELLKGGSSTWAEVRLFSVTARLSKLKFLRNFLGEFDVKLLEEEEEVKRRKRRAVRKSSRNAQEHGSKQASPAVPQLTPSPAGPRGNVNCNIENTGLSQQKSPTKTLLTSSTFSSLPPH